MTTDRFPPLDTLKAVYMEVMDEWDGIEDAFAIHFGLLLQARHPSVATILFSKIASFQQTREIAELLASEFLPTQVADEFGKLMVRLKKMTTKRSRIVHGRWTAGRVEQLDGSWREKWHRKYEAYNLDTNAPESNAEFMRTKGTYRWYLDDLKRTVSEFRELSHDVRLLTERIAYSLAPPPP